MNSSRYIKNLEYVVSVLLPVFNLYHKQNNIPVPDIDIPTHLREPSIPAIFKKDFGVLEFTSNERKPRKN